MDNKFFTVLPGDSRNTYAYYIHRIFWNEEIISGKPNANGYIVQRVHFETNTPNLFQSPDYYEAWPVIGGSCKDNSGYDDSFEGEYTYRNDYLLNSIGVKDDIKYQTKIFWVDKYANSSEYAIVDSWEPGGARMANELKSVYVKDCPIFERIDTPFTREYMHSYDCTSDESILDAIHHFYRAQIENGLPYWKEDMHEFLTGSEYEHILEKL